MPVIIVESNKISLDKKREYVKALTKITAEAYDLPESTVTVLIKELKDENIGVSGQLLSEIE
ncbi:4-oxalocrotonate tautomerase [Methanobrevibacter cuticularis]|uniref:4-oxalocrotonate tautomerase n=1 Tax=Methanobrevibacter cuticularis TaxID=47311 RepID=A0A166EKU5_9EURY|nr:4-oxalocrotonate tautomerase DmpI [Methanobrevibacter cuticularis]KZX16766.1 4-oxalocrotonate tautomerase [Methanobrevibacter cuticularis]